MPFIIEIFHVINITNIHLIPVLSSNMPIDPELALVLGLSQSTLAENVILPTYLNETNVNFIDHGFPTERPKPLPVQVILIKSG